MPLPNKEVWKGNMQVRDELDQEERDLTPSIDQLINHQTCHRKFLKEQKYKQEKQTTCIPKI